MSDYEFTDRYGGNYPDPATICKGQCEGMGVYPQYENDPGITDAERAAVEVRKAENGPSEDGCYFITCPDCGGTGKAPA